MFKNVIDFPFTRTLEEGYQVIRRELDALSEGSFAAFPERQLYLRENSAGAATGASIGPDQEGKGWNVYGFYFFGRRMKKHCEACPETDRILQCVPGLTSAAFSWLEPGTHIRPHVGYTGEVLRCHLGVMMPAGCTLRVGSECRDWEEGKCLVFDDTTEHEVWNRSSQSRVVLLLDFKKPDAFKMTHKPDATLFAPPGGQ